MVNQITMINDTEIENFKQKARSAGYTESQIAAEIERKKQEQIQATKSTPTPTPTLPNNNPQPQPEQQNNKPGIMQQIGDTAGNVINGLANFFLPRTTAAVKDTAAGFQLNAQ